MKINEKNTERIKQAYDKWKKKAKAKGKLKILFIAESPPAQTKKGKQNYFYFGKEKYNKNELTYQLFNTLKFNPMGTKKAGLNEFIEKSYFLIDAIEEPQFYKNNKSQWKLKEYGKQIKENKNRLIKEIKDLEPENIFIIGYGVYKRVFNLLQTDSYVKKRLSKKKIHFPSNGHQGKFNYEIRNIKEIQKIINN